VEDGDATVLLRKLFLCWESATWNRIKEQRDVGLALILSQADAVEQWKSGSSKSKTRNGGSDAGEEEFCPGVRLEQLRKEYARAKICISCCKKSM
jgi:hypothetical protein